MINVNKPGEHCWEAHGSHNLMPKEVLLARLGASHQQGPKQQVTQHRDTHIYLHIECLLMELAASSIIQCHKATALSHMGAQLQELLDGTLQQTQSRWRFNG